MANINETIEKLLKEPITHHWGDSGGAYGYRYEKNQKDGILKGLQPIEEYTDDETLERTLDVTIPVYDFLTYNLVKDDVAQGIETQLLQELKIAGIDPYSIFEVADFLNSGKFTGMHIENKVEYVNTYNYEEFLSQTLLYAILTNGFEYYVILEVHNGCDVRSGYTYPQVFKIKDIDYWFAGQYDRKTECECGLNDYTIYGTDDPTDSCGDYVSKEEIYNRTYLEDNLVKCKDCKTVVKGGFMKW